MRRTVRMAGALAAAGALIVGLGACGDDDEAGDDGNEATEAELAGGAEDAAADTAAFCDAAVAVDAVNLESGSGEATPEDVEAAFAAAEESAPDEVAEAVATMVADGRAMAAEAAENPEAEGPPPMPSEAFYPASAEVSAYLSDNCDVETVDVTATNYAFAGLDGPVASGTTVLNLANDGTEFHEIVLIQVAEGEERPFEELMALSDEEIEGVITEKGFVMAPPGAQSFTTTDLEPGRHVAICFVPVGATPEALASGAPLAEDDGHFMHGMVTEFEVS
jgi:hypothetical protein